MTTWEGALCAQVGGDYWHPEKGESSRPAKRICGRCPVKQSCLDYAVEHQISYGVWGGLAPRQRLALRAGKGAVA